MVDLTSGIRLRTPKDGSIRLSHETSFGLRIGLGTHGHRCRPRARQSCPRDAAKTTRTVPLEFKDTATGEHFDVVQDDDLAPDLSEKPGDEGGTTVQSEESRTAGAVEPTFACPGSASGDTTYSSGAVTLSFVSGARPRLQRAW